MSLRSKCHARFMVSIVQCLRGLPTRFFLAMLGCALPMKVACLVGAVAGSLSVCISSWCCDVFTCVYTCSIRFRLAPSWCAACFLTSLLVFFLSMYVVFSFSIFRSPFSWNVSSLLSCIFVRCMVSSA